MNPLSRPVSLTQLARAGFGELSEAAERLRALSEATGVPSQALLTALGHASDPDQALTSMLRMSEHGPGMLLPGTADGGDPELLLDLSRFLGASPGLADFLLRHPKHLRGLFAHPVAPLPGAQELISDLLLAVEGLSGEPGWCALRERYRVHLAQLARYDLAGPPSAALFERVARSLSDLAQAALEASLTVARRTISEPGGRGPRCTEEEIGLTRLAIIAMGKCGAEELNYVSDVDVVFVGESADPEQLGQERALLIATKLASETMRGIHEFALEPPLWEVDANLRPEGKNGPLVRSLSSHLAYYGRWAKTWEFQALLKARAIAGDRELGEAYVSATRPLVWESSGREDFVGSVQRMRERVTEHISDDDVAYQLKLGPGGLRDVEFAVQLLQLVHGQNDPSLRVRGTLDGLRALSDSGYIARSDEERLTDAYATIRLLEHRLQLRHLRRTALMPRDEAGQRWLARASGLAPDAQSLVDLWESLKRTVRELHLKIFYAPLLSAVAELPGEEFVLDGSRARDRLLAIGFRDPDGAMRHIQALGRGTSRRAQIMRNLLPVLLQWFSDGADPDYGLVSFRRISDALQHTPWYLRMLRDGSGAAQRLTRVLSGSRFIGEILESIPESVGWLEGDEQLRPASRAELDEELGAIASRHHSVNSSAPFMRTVHRREVLRLAMGALTGVLTLDQVASGLDAAHSALLSRLVREIRRDLHRQTPLVETPFVDSRFSSAGDGLEFALIAMGRFGGAELGFSSDLDMIAVLRQAGAENEAVQRRAKQIITELLRLTEDPKLTIDIDFNLRPEGKNGPLVRSLDSYRSYYERWSLTWEAQALLRAEALCGDEALLTDFMDLADTVRYPVTFGEEQLREVRRVKARVEAERLPKGAEPKRHLKLGPGSLSDVEWLVQLRQLEHGATVPELRTTGTVAALQAAAETGLLAEDDVDILLDSWRLASSIRSAIRLWSNRNSDVLPRDRGELDGVARILGYPAGSTTELEERYLQATRRARIVFERLFFGVEDPLMTP